MIGRVCVSGGAGFIGSHLVEHLLAQDVKVHVVDNFRTGRPEFLPAGATLYDGDVHDHETLIRAIDGCDWVLHLAANAEGRRGFTRPHWDVDQNILGTSHVLEAMRAVGCEKVFFASSGSVYGNYTAPRITEDCPFPTQTSLYGASKIAGEGLVGAYVEAHGFTGVIGRWMQAIGERYLHGHVIDFVRKIQRSSGTVTVLGDGRQAKSGLYVKDLAAGIWTAVAHHDRNPGGVHVYNIGGSDMVTVDESVRLIAQTMGTAVQLVHEGGTWPGDNPRTYLDSSKLRALGWNTTVGMREAIRRTVRYLIDESQYL